MSTMVCFVPAPGFEPETRCRDRTYYKYARDCTNSPVRAGKELTFLYNYEIISHDFLKS